MKQVIVDFDRMPEWQELLQGDVLISAMGTTRTQAGSKDAQYRVDYTYPYQAARYARRNGVTRHILISSAGANSHSQFFYLRMKGQLEEAIRDLGFARNYVLQPSVLKGKRDVDRRGERWSAAILEWVAKFSPPARHRRPIHGREVAAAVLALLHISPTPPEASWHLEELFTLALGYRNRI